MAIKSPQGSVVDLPRGTTDFNTKDSIALNEILSIIEETFKRYGFSPIITPAIENTQVLNAKAYGDESTKEMYVIEGGGEALRFDLTVPLARYMAMNKDLPLPFKRYQIGTVWRKDEPQRMRNREFFQADVDIIGSKDVQSDAECIAAMADAINSVGITEFEVLVNSRGVLNAILTSFGVIGDMQQKAIRVIDKMSKLSTKDTITQLVALGMEQNNADKLLNFLTSGNSNEEKLDKLLINVKEAAPDIENIKKLLSTLASYGMTSNIRVDFSLARGLDYYTGLVWETVVTSENQKTPSIASGGRYDNLIGLYSKSPVPAVGSSIGVSRVFELLKNRSESKTYAKVFIATIGKDNIPYSMEIAKKLRSEGIYVDLNVNEKGISKQLEYSNSIGIKYVAIIGNKENAAKQVNFRNMLDGTEELIDVDALISKLRA